MKNIIFLTSTYPYPKGEQFIENEINYWDNYDDIKVVIVPMKATSQPRKIPKGIEIDLTLAKTNTTYSKLKGIINVIVSPIFWKEFKYILNTRGYDLTCIMVALKSVGHVLRIKKSLEIISKKLVEVDIAYCYWNDVQCYSSILLKNEKIIKKVVSRAHGGDLYEERCLKNYMPLKRQFSDHMDVVYAISESGKKYLEDEYKIPNEKVKVSRLGVHVPNGLSNCGEENKLVILSVSFCTSVKRIDKIINSIACANKIINTGMVIQWIHIGDGPLFKEIKKQAERKLTSIGIDWKMIGMLSNAEVNEFYKNNTIDIFINASESEGVPVSIMEAMSYGVPVIAPNVGAISEIVSNDCGCLMQSNPEVDEIALAIATLGNKCKDKSIRTKASEIISEKYNADKNYRKFIKDIIG